MIEARDLTFIHQGCDSPLLREISFKLEQGEVATVLGPNGSGKTTLFQCLLGIRKLAGGEVLFDGRPVSAIKRTALARKLALTPQDHEAPFPYSVFDMALMGRLAHVGLFSSPGDRDRRIVREALKTMGIDALADRPYTMLSGGEKQMTLIARCLAQEAPAMLLDEPTSHLDFRNQILTLKKVRDIVKERNLVALLNLHDPNLALLFSDRVLLLNGGRLVAQGPPSEVISKESLKAVYGIETEFLSMNGMRMICPKI